jgi:hypothetical protein
MPNYPAAAGSLAYDQNVSLESPVGGGEAIVITSGDHALTYASRALWVGSGGDVKVDMLDGTALTFLGVSEGTLLPIRISKVYSSGTTASNMVAVW